MSLDASASHHCCGVCFGEGKVVELAACKHLLCFDCFHHTASVRLKCPVKTCYSMSTKERESIDDNLTDSGDSEIVVVHGLCSSRVAWQRVLDERLTDVSKRYDTYLHLFLSKNALLIHVPKTGGTSFEDALFGIRNRSQHAPMQYWKKRIGMKKWSEMFKFAIVRHPFHRLVSGYTYWKNGALEGQLADHPFVHRCRKELDTLTKFVAYLVHVHRNNLWDCRDVQGCDGTCPTQFRPQLWYFLQNSNVDGTEKEGNEKDGDGGKDNKLSHVSKESFKNGITTTSAALGVGMEEMDYIARFEDLQGAYQTITRTLSMRHQTSSSSSSSSSSSHPSVDALHIVPSAVKNDVLGTSLCPSSTSPCTVFVCANDSGNTNAGGDSTGGNRNGVKNNGGCDDKIQPQNGTSTTMTSSANDDSGSSSASSSNGSGSGSISGNMSTIHWPAELPHTRASLHPPELPDCFRDPVFVASVLEVYQCDFDAFGYSPNDI